MMMMMLLMMMMMMMMVMMMIDDVHDDDVEDDDEIPLQNVWPVMPAEVNDDEDIIQVFKRNFIYRKVWNMMKL